MDRNEKTHLNIFNELRSYKNLITILTSYSIKYFLIKNFVIRFYTIALICIMEMLNKI